MCFAHPHRKRWRIIFFQHDLDRFVFFPGLSYLFAGLFVKAIEKNLHNEQGRKT